MRLPAEVPTSFEEALEETYLMKTRSEVGGITGMSCAGKAQVSERETRPQKYPLKMGGGEPFTDDSRIRARLTSLARGSSTRNDTRASWRQPPRTGVKQQGTELSFLSGSERGRLVLGEGNLGQSGQD